MQVLIYSIGEVEKPAQPPAPLPMKPLEFLGSSRDDLVAMPAGVRHDIGVDDLAQVRYKMIGAKP